MRNPFPFLLTILWGVSASAVNGWDTKVGYTTGWHAVDPTRQ
jgi:hypothetical protein